MSDAVVVVSGDETVTSSSTVVSISDDAIVVVFIGAVVLILAFGTAVNRSAMTPTMRVTPLSSFCRRKRENQHHRV